jgi:hypothetical protein
MSIEKGPIADSSPNISISKDRLLLSMICKEMKKPNLLGA